MTQNLNWISREREKFLKWVMQNYDFSITDPVNNTFYRYIVKRIVYENEFSHLWSMDWFQKGIQAFGLTSLCAEGHITILNSPTKTIVKIDEQEYEIDTFLNGDTLDMKTDPENSDLRWDPVFAMYFILSEYDESNS